MTRPSSGTGREGGREGRGQRGNSVAWEDGAEQRAAAALELVVRANRGSDVTSRLSQSAHKHENDRAKMAGKERDSKGK